jgi:hypothetical protein
MPSEFRRPPVPQTPEFHRRLEDELCRAVIAHANGQILTPGGWRLLRKLRHVLHGGLVLCLAGAVLLWGDGQGHLGLGPSTTAAFQQGPVLSLDQLDRTLTWLDPTPGAVFRTSAIPAYGPQGPNEVPPQLEVR